jgi:hypothetical protein
MNKDYKSLYFYLAGQMVTSAEVLETATVALDGAVNRLTLQRLQLRIWLKVLRQSPVRSLSLRIKLKRHRKKQRK